MAKTMRCSGRVPENEARIAASVQEPEPTAAGPLADLDDAEVDFLLDQLEWLVQDNIRMAGDAP